MQVLFNRYGGEQEGKERRLDSWNENFDRGNGDANSAGTYEAYVAQGTFHSQEKSHCRCQVACSRPFMINCSMGVYWDTIHCHPY